FCLFNVSLRVMGGSMLLHPLLALCSQPGVSAGSSPPRPCRCRPRAPAAAVFVAERFPCPWRSSSSSSSSRGPKQLATARAAGVSSVWVDSENWRVEAARPLEPPSSARLEALCRIDSARSAGSTLDAAAYAAGLGACAATGSWKPARRLLNEMRRRGLEVAAADVTSALAACRERWDAAIRVLRWADDLGPGQALGIEAYNLVIEACIQSGQFEWALALLAELRGSDDDRPAPNRETYFHVARACERAGEWQWAIRVVRMMQETLGGDLRTFHSAMTACDRAQETAWVLRLLKDMRSASIVPDSSVYDVVVRSSSRGRLWLRAMTLLEESLSDGQLPSSLATYRSAMELCAKVSSWQRAIWVLNLMAAEKLDADLFSLECAAAACKANSKDDLAEYFEVRRQELSKMPEGP
ncbi:unnamed protein product, partial [Polarella glacialis]